MARGRRYADEMVLLAALAAAHSPHDVATFLAADPDGTLFSADTELLTWTRDGGASWDYRYLDVGTPVCGTSDGWFTVGTDEAGVWTSLDGIDWSPAEGPQHVNACAPGVWAGLEGLWVDGVQVLDVPVLAVAGADAALLADSTVRLAPDWTATTAATRPTCVAMDGAAPVVGSTLTELLRWDGAAWVAVPGSPLGAQALAIDGDTWLAATDREGVFVSRDAGATWTLDAEGFEPINDGPGSPGDGVHFLGLTVADGVWYSAQWEGAWWKRADDTRWRQGSLDTVPRARGVEWLGTELLGAVYGGGVYRGTPGADDWRVLSRGVSWPYPKQVVQREDDIYLVSGSILYRSRDGGNLWEDLPLGADDVGDHVAVAPDYPTTPVVIVGARTDGVGGAWISLDRGDTWAWSPVTGGCTEKPSNIATDGVTTWMACGYQGELYRSPDWGQTWELVDTLGANIWDILPEDPPLLATERGLLRAGAELETVAFDGVYVDQILRAPDGQLWLTTPGSGLYRVSDAGTAESVGWPTLDRIEDLAINADGVLAVGTRKGIYTSPDGVAWTRANNVDFLDDTIQFWWFDDRWTTESGAAYNGAHARGGGAGARAELDWSGVQVRVWGEALDGARLTINADGLETTVSLPAETAYGVLYTADAAPGAHRLTVEVALGQVTLDTAEVWRADPPATDTPDTGAPPSDPGCGCGSGKAAGLLLLLIPGWWRRRKGR